MNHSSQSTTSMTYYACNIQKIKDEVFFKEYLYDRLIASKKYMDRCFAEKIDIKNLAKIACMSYFHYIRVFKLVYGLSPHQYLMSYRIEKAKEYLRLGLRIQDLCYAVGFESPGSFKTLFKRLTNTTPAAYRNRKAIFKTAN